MWRCLLAVAVAAAAGSAARAEPPQRLRIYEPMDPSGPRAAPASPVKKLFLNFCPGDCTVMPGTTDSTAVPDRSIVPTKASMLTRFSRGSTVQRLVVDCVRDVFSRFDLEIVTKDPGATPHFEVMIAGRPEQVQQDARVGGISPFNCGVEYIPNALAFVFDVWGTNVNEICATVAQELAHAFRLDHVIDASDPMTYNTYAERRQFVDAQVQCGSDCVNGKSPFELTCTGPNLQNHTCSCTGQQTQNSVKLLVGLFGAGPPTSSETICARASECPAATDICLGGRCVPGPDATGGLGTSCTEDGQCASSICASSTEGEHHCVEICRLGAGECPDGFGCLDSGNMSGVCWPGYDDGTGGFCGAGGRPGAGLVLGLGVLALVVRRRRRR